MRIAFIVQRYGTEILGGAEYLCRLTAERLAAKHQVDVLTTCAQDYTTWKNDYAEGADRVHGVTVRRFANARTRDMASFNQYSEWIFNNRHTRQDEMEWLKQQGPWSPALIEFLERHHQQYDVLVFYTYLYTPTVLGLRVAPAKSLLVPTAHDEPAINFGIYEDVFGGAMGLIWNTDAERRFVQSKFALRALVDDVVGCGVDLPEEEAGVDADDTPVSMPTSSREPFPPHIEGPANAFRRRHRMHGPFLLYGGRIDPGKGCEELLEYFQTYVNDNGDATLMLMGAKLMPLPDNPRVRFAGMLSDAERLRALEAATVVVVPSPYESLSLLALEAFAVGTPVLANARSEVLVDHCRQSNAGLYYADRWEFVDALKLLMGDAKLRAAMGANGKAYIQHNYRWDVVLAKYDRLFARMRAPERDERHDGRDQRDVRDQRQSRDQNQPRSQGQARPQGQPRAQGESRDQGGRRERGGRRDRRPGRDRRDQRGGRRS